MRTLREPDDAATRFGFRSERAEILDRAADAIRRRREELARLLSREIGKPLKQAFVEVDRCVQTLTFSAIEARTLAGRGIPLDAHPAGTGRRGYTIRVPIGDRGDSRPSGGRDPPAPRGACPLAVA